MTNNVLNGTLNPTHSLDRYRHGLHHQCDRRTDGQNYDSNSVRHDALKNRRLLCQTDLQPPALRKSMQTGVSPLHRARVSA